MPIDESLDLPRPLRMTSAKPLPNERNREPELP